MKEMEMEMVAAESIGIGEDLTPPLFPLSYSLHDSFLPSHCASCFSPLPPEQHDNDHHLLYCSPSCSSSHSPLHLSSASHLLSPNPCNGQTSDLRVALLLLLQIKLLKSYHRICGLMTNRHNLLMSTHDDDLSTRINNGARAIAAATSMRDGRPLDSQEVFLLEEAVLCAVVTNAVEVQDTVGRSVGIAVYDIPFSWINHSCSPNACYRFLPPDTQSDQQRFLITPNGCEPIQFSSNSDPLTGLPEIRGGPRIVVRSIKMVNKGEQVTIAYTDLLQPKELRQSELWSKYRFTCYCHRCAAVPLTLVDQRLQEICHSSGSFLHNLGVETYSEHIDDAIDDYLSSNDAESCCKKLEDALLNGFHDEQIVIRLHPQNHLSLNAYTTLASAYKVRAAQDENGFKMKRFGAAYSLLLALLTHHLFLYESCLIVPVSNFWINAGESLLNLATSLVSSSLPTSGKCCSRCGLTDAFDANFYHNKDLDVKFLNCITDIAPEVWKFLVVENGYLEVVKDPMDFRWFERLMSGADHNMNVEGITAASEEGQEVAELIYRFGAHCLLYGGILSKISSGHLTSYVGRLIFGKTPRPRV